MYLKIFNKIIYNELMLGILLVISGLFSYLFYIEIFSVVLLVIVFIFIYRILRTQKIKLIEIWIFSYCYILGGEYIVLKFINPLYTDRILFLQSQTIFIVAFGMTLIGYFLIFKRNNSDELKKDYRINLDRLRKYYIIIFAAQLLVVFYLFLSRDINQYLIATRTSSDDLQVSGIQSLIKSQLQILIIIFPVIILYLGRFYYEKVFYKIIAIITFLMSFLYILSSGTRFYLGYLIGGIGFLVLKRLNNLSMKQIILGVIIIIIVLNITIFMQTSRTHGIVNTDMDYIFGTLEFSKIFDNQGLFNVTMTILEHQGRELELLYGRENAFILYFWVPRVIWPDKPTMSGYWLMRQFTTTNYSGGHSFSGGFVFPALLDFGPIFGSIFCIFYGMLIGYFERLFNKYRYASLNPIIIFVSLLIFTVFFMMRSLQTALINLIMFSLVGFLPYMLAYNRCKVHDKNNR